MAVRGQTIRALTLFGASGLGFAGVLFVARPDGSHAGWICPALLISSALCGALSIIQIRLRRHIDSLFELFQKGVVMVKGSCFRTTGYAQSDDSTPEGYQ